MKLYELEIQDENIDEVFAISMVEAGAIESDWIAFDKEEVAFAKVDTDQRMVIGAILIPNKRIMRIDGEGQPYEVFFSPETIKKLSHNYLMKKYQDKVTLEHDKKIKGVTLVESWIKDGKLDKSNNYGLNLPMGSWIGIMKITDEKIWNDYVKTGKTNGFSIEGSFEHKLVKASKDELWASSMLEKIKAIILESYPNLANPTYSGEEADDFISPAMFEEGVPHYTADGKLWEGPTHKDAEGRLMTGETHTEASEYLYHREELEIEPNPCWEGYEPIGLKPDGSPNCVPIKLSQNLAEESYSDYGDGVKSNAKKVIEYTEKNGWGSCGTPVGKQRANQLAKGEPISIDTIKRMYSYLSRHEGDLVSSKTYSDGCGKLMYDAWGGKAGLGWSRNKLRELGLINE